LGQSNDNKEALMTRQPLAVRMRYKDELCVAFKCDAVSGSAAITFAFQDALFVKTQSGNETFSTSDHPYKGDAKVDAYGSTSKCMLNTDKEDRFSVQQRQKKYEYTIDIRFL
jgi:hypothetical protein